MRPSLRVGINCTKRCNCHCAHCYYRHNDDFNTPYDKTLSEVMAETIEGKTRGCKQAVLVGWGETSLWPHLFDWLNECRLIGMETNIITNGTIAVSRYAKMYELGLDHLHISIEGLNELDDRIMGAENVFKRQHELLNFLLVNDLPWRSDTTLMQANYKQMPDIVNFIAEHGAYHIVLLGFLSHYQWAEPDKGKTMLVQPAELQPYIEQAITNILSAGSATSLRYHPMCHLRADYRKYVTNARYVPADFYEWDYGHAGDTPAQLWDGCVNHIGGAVAIKGAPCISCTHYVHCGGWNRMNAETLGGAGLIAIKEPVDQTPGFLFDQNPINNEPYTK
jgi:pyruvate-formate lyase-activating enzyme